MRELIEATYTLPAGLGRVGLKPDPQRSTQCTASVHGLFPGLRAVPPHHVRRRDQRCRRRQRAACAVAARLAADASRMASRRSSPRARFTVVATDLRGYGDSSKPPSGENHAGYSKRAMAQDQVEVMRQLGFERFAVVGHDRGGRVACRMALDHPQAVTTTGVARHRADAHRLHAGQQESRDLVLPLVLSHPAGAVAGDAARRPGRAVPAQLRVSRPDPGRDRRSGVRRLPALLCKSANAARDVRGLSRRREHRSAARRDGPRARCCPARRSYCGAYTARCIACSMCWKRGGRARPARRARRCRRVIGCRRSVRTSSAQRCWNSSLNIVGLVGLKPDLQPMLQADLSGTCNAIYESFRRSARAGGEPPLQEKP